MGKIQKAVKRIIGKETHTFMVEGESFMEVMQTEAKLSFGNVYKCGCCGSTNLTLGAHRAQNKFDYAYVRCRDCKGTLNFGQQQEDKDIVYLRTVQGSDGNKVYDWQKFEPQN